MANIQERTSKKGITTYKVVVRKKGHPTQTATFKRKTDAIKWGKSIESAIDEGRHFASNESKKRTLSDLFTAYKNSAPVKTLKDRAHIFAYWEQALGVYSLKDVTPSRIKDKRDELTAEKKAPATVMKYLATLSHVFAHAVQELEWVQENPVLKVKKPSLPDGRVRYLSDQERTTLLAVCTNSETNKVHPALLPVVTLALSTGMRQAEIMNLHWSTPKNPPTDSAWGVVDLRLKKVTLHATKNGEKRLLPLVGPALSLLQDMAKVRRMDTTLLFPAKHPPKGTDEDGNKLPVRPVELRKPWETALTKAKIENFHFHDLRHTCASYLAMNGATLAEIAEVLGHKSLQMVQRYAHLSEAHTAGVVERMNAKMFGGVDA